MTAPAVADLSKLPAAGFRAHGMWFWAATGFMLIEAAGFGLAMAAYVYLMNGASQWPLSGRAPDLFWGTLQTLLLLASLVPAAILSRAGRLRQLGPVRAWGVAVTVLNAAAIVIRGFELAHLNTRWDMDAYGSVVWGLMLLHTLHLLTDFIDTALLVVFLFTHPVSAERFSDVDDDCLYWAYVVFTWLPIYALVYWAPRLLP